MGFEFNGHQIKVITIKQPYASLIVNGIKDVENRTWAKKIYKDVCKNWLLVHSSTKVENKQKELFHYDFEYPKSAIIGMMHINRVGNISDSVHPTMWEKGPKCWYIDAVIKFITPVYTIGALGQWDPYPSLHDKLTEQIKESMYNIIPIDNIEFVRDKCIYYVTQRGNYMTWEDVINSLTTNIDTFIYKFIQFLINIEYKSYFWECDRVIMNKPFRFSIFNSKTLSERTQDNNAFNGIINCSKKTQVISFLSLSKDTNLIVPCKKSYVANYTSLATFSRTAPIKQQVEFWKKVGKNIKEGDWVSTSGLGVSWLHVRIANRPKYYHDVFDIKQKKSGREYMEQYIYNFKFPDNFVNIIAVGSDWKKDYQLDLITYYLELLPKDTKIIGIGHKLKDKCDEVGILCEIYLSNWKKYGRNAKSIRNKEILNNDINLVTVFGNEEKDLVDSTKDKLISLLEIN